MMLAVKNMAQLVTRNNIIQIYRLGIHLYTFKIGVKLECYRFF